MNSKISQIDLDRIIDRIQNIHDQSKCTKWILQNINKSTFFDIISMKYVEYLLRELIVFRKGAFYARLKRILLSCDKYIDQCRQVRDNHTNKREKKGYNSGLFIVPFNIPRKPYHIIHDGYCIYEKHRIVTTCIFTHFSSATIIKRQVKYQNKCFYCNCRYTKSHNNSRQHLHNYTTFFSLLDSIQPTLPDALWQYIIHFLYE
jgi:hypothetical protein